MKQAVRHLVSGFKPLNYRLELSLDPEQMTFSGQVKISGNKLGRPSKRLVFHQKGLKFSSATLTRHDKNGEQIIAVDRINTHSGYDEVRLHSVDLLFPGHYTVVIKFSGKITDQMNGIYPCYFKHEGKEQKLLATQFESHYARNVFPCIDEPIAKATFDLTIMTPNDGSVVIANTPMKEQCREKPGTLVTTFETTPIMSTYLLAFVYGKMDFKETTTARGTAVRTYATPNNIKHTDFALKTAARCLEYYEDYFGIPYPLQKCDLVALPDFASGAMENWGLITFREQFLFFDPANTSLGTKQTVALVVAHELAHQWFGNLVTMHWWTDLWLNEGFASWIEYLAVDKLFPDWDVWTQFIVDEQQPALKIDALHHTHPVEVEVNHPDEIHSIFDIISYNKGASVIHMLHGYLGGEDFRNGLRHYLAKHAYKNTSTKDLWGALEEVSGKPVKEFMHDWTSKAGFPLVTVEANEGSLSIKQHRFYMQAPKNPSPTLWPIPLLADDTLPPRLDGAELLQPKARSVSYQINKDQSGFYRTVYDQYLLAELSPKISGMEPLDRLGILADCFETAKAGYSSVIEALKLLEVYRNEESAVVWDVIASGVINVLRVMDDEEVQDLIKPFIIKLTAKELGRLGWEESSSDSHFDRLLRPTILGLAAGAEAPSVVNECQKRFKNMTRPEDIPADLRGVVYATAARFGDKDTFDRLLAMHKSSESSEESVTIAAALMSFKQPELVAEALSLITTKTVRFQDVIYWLIFGLYNRHAKRQVWEWIIANWVWLDENLGTDLSFFNIPNYVARTFSDVEFLKEYTAFFKDKASPKLNRSISQGEETLSWHIAWKQRDLASVRKFLRVK